MNENIVAAIRRLLDYLERPTVSDLFVQAWDRLNAEGMDIDLQRTPSIANAKSLVRSAVNRLVKTDDEEREEATHDCDLRQGEQQAKGSTSKSERAKGMGEGAG
jgi:hypothetical protein